MKEENEKKKEKGKGKDRDSLDRKVGTLGCPSPRSSCIPKPKEKGKERMPEQDLLERDKLKEAEGGVVEQLKQELYWPSWAGSHQVAELVVMVAVVLVVMVAVVGNEHYCTSCPVLKLIGYKGKGIVLY